MDPKKPIKYPADYVESVVPTVKFSISFPFFTDDAFECLAWTYTGHKAEGSKVAKPEALFKIREAILDTLGTRAADISFVAPEEYSDPMIAEVDVYAGWQSLSGAGMWLTGDLIKQIGKHMIVKYPELDMCSYAEANDVDYKTEWKTKPVFPANIPPGASWSSAATVVSSTILQNLCALRNSLGASCMPAWPVC